MHVAIFKGKKGENNESILKTLYEKGYLSAWKIARQIAENDPKRARKNWYHETQKVYSVLIRKGGRLEELLGKEFIEKTDQGYCLTIYKGLCSALTLYENVIPPAIDDLSKIEEVFPEFKEMRDIIYRLHPEAQVEQYEIIRRTTKELLVKGLNLDTISNREFNRFWNAQMQESIFRRLKEKKDDRGKVGANPELREHVSKFLLRIHKELMEQMKDLEKTLNRWKVNQQKKLKSKD